MLARRAGNQILQNLGQAIAHPLADSHPEQKTFSELAHLVAMFGVGQPGAHLLPKPLDTGRAGKPARGVRR